MKWSWNIRVSCSSSSGVKRSRITGVLGLRGKILIGRSWYPLWAEPNTSPCQISQLQLPEKEPSSARVEPWAMMGALWESRFKEGKDCWERRVRNAREQFCSQPRSVQGEGRRFSRPGAVVPCSLGEGCHPAACEHHMEQIPMCSHARAQGQHCMWLKEPQPTENPHRRCRALCWSSWRLGPMV